MKRFSYKKTPSDFEWTKKTLTLESRCNHVIEELQKLLVSSSCIGFDSINFLLEESFYSLEKSKNISGLKNFRDFHFKRNESVNNHNTFLEMENYFLALQEVLKKNRISNQIFFLLHEKIKKDHFGIKQRSFQYRKHQNWIGKEGCCKKDAYFFPPKAQDVPRKMKELIKFLNLNDQHKLIQLAIGFAQFLVIHPFMDGNGRIARAFIPFYLKKKKVLLQPVILLSHYFKKNRSDYYRLLFWVTQNEKWESWIQFFLKGILESACHVKERLGE